MIDVKEKDELRFRGEERIAPNPKDYREYDIKGLTGVWIERYDEEGSESYSLWLIEVHFNIDIYYNLAKCARSNNASIKLFDNLMMTFIHKWKHFAELVNEAKEAGYSVSFFIDELDNRDITEWELTCKLVNNSQQQTITKCWEITTENPCDPGELDNIVDSFEALLTDVVVESKKEPSLAEIMDVQAEMEERIRNEKIRQELVKQGVDIVNHPGHYETGKFECIEVMQEVMGVEAVKDFCICNVFKYVYRHKNKNGLEDIKKAKWYIDKYLEMKLTKSKKGSESKRG